MPILPILARIFCYAWASPTTLVGLLLVPTVLVSGGGAQLVQGVIEVHGGWLGRRLARGLPFVGRASAMTLGHVVLGSSPERLASSRAHERVHVRQAERWGPLFVPAYLTAGLAALVRGGHPYRDNPFEREAFAADGDH